MMDNPTYSAFASAYPASARQILNLARMEKAISSLCFPAFFEPVSALDNIGSAGSQRLLGPMAPAINAWRRHIAYGTIARIRALTEPVIQHLVGGELTIASILQRTILENAGRAALAVERLTDCGKRGSWDDLRAVIPKSLFGTCMAALEDTIFDGFWETTAQRPAKVGQLIDALERLAGTSDASGQSFFSGLYALLCDLAHASQRANQSYCRVLEARADGWTVQYHWREDTGGDAIEGALKSTLRCIQAGYGASAMLLAWDFAESPDGLVWHGLSTENAGWIWENLLDPSLVFG